MALWLAEALFILVIFLTNIIQAITGFAGTVLAMPFSILLVGQDFARPILNVVALLVCVVVMVTHHKNIEWKTFLYIIIPTLIGMVGGIFLREFVTSRYFLKFYGLIICLVSTLFFFKPNPPKLPRWLEIMALLGAGVMHGMFVSGGPLVILAVKSKINDKEKFRSTLVVVWVILNSILLGEDLIMMNWTLDMLWVLLIAIPTIALSLLIGKLLFKKFNNDAFMKFTCILLFISGFTLLC